MVHGKEDIFFAYFGIPRDCEIFLDVTGICFFQSRKLSSELLDTWCFQQLIGFHYAFVDLVAHFSFPMHLAYGLLK